MYFHYVFSFFSDTCATNPWLRRAGVRQSVSSLFLHGAAAKLARLTATGTQGELWLWQTARPYRGPATLDRSGLIG